MAKKRDKTFTFDPGNYSKVNYVPIPTASNQKSFKVALNKNNFIQKIISVIAAGVKRDASEDNEDDKNNENMT